MAFRVRRAISGIDVGASAHPVREEITVAPQPAAFQGLAGRAVPPTISRTHRRSGAIEKSSTTSGISITGSSPNSITTPRYKIGEEVRTAKSRRRLGGPGQGDDAEAE